MGIGVCLFSLILLFWQTRSLNQRLPVLTNNSAVPEPKLTDPVLPVLTIENVLDPHYQPTASLSSTKVVTLAVTGDVLTARSVNAITTKNNDFTWAFKNTAPELRAADITFINLETPLTADCPIKNDGMIFCGDLRNIEGLQYAGVDLVNLANNHMGNQGEDGVAETIQALERASIAHTGINQPTYLNAKGTRFAFLGFNEVDRQAGVPVLTDELLKSQIEQAKINADVVIVQFHWGQEYTYQPTVNQQRLAHAAIDAGADLIVGNHPHWWQPIEQYKNGFITYSHGNFVFDQMWSQETREGLVGYYTFYDGKLVDVDFKPILIENYGQPRWMDEEESSQLLEKLKVETQNLNGN